MPADDISRARSLLQAAGRVLVFTGAGVSAESGVPTFRGAGGLWKQFRPEELATPQAFARDPRTVWEWYAWRRGLVAACPPNAAHEAIARACGRGGVRAGRRAGVRAGRRAGVLVTQNVDDLHERAGTPDVIKLHGSLFVDRCSRCAWSGPAGPVDATSEATLPRCGCGALLRPGVVWFGEALPDDPFARAAEAAASCDVCLVVGTSGAVHPAAGLVHAARAAGADIVVVDPGETAFDAIAAVKLAGGAAAILPDLLS